MQRINSIRYGEWEYVSEGSQSFCPFGLQIALIAVNVLGESMSTENAMQMMEKLNNERTENALASICDDLSFSMYVEESIVGTIRELETKKAKAVNGKCIPRI